MPDTQQNLIGLAVHALAQEGDGSVVGVPGSESAPAGQGGPQNQPQSFGPIFWLLPLFLILMLVMTSLSGRKERKRKQDMLAAIKRNDRVQTVGGVIGTVTDVAKDEITLQVDDQTKTRIRFAKGSIQTVLRSAGDKSEPAEAAAA